MSNVEFTDNSAKVLEAFQAAIGRSLERMGQTAEDHAKEYAPVDTGHLKKSIHHAVAEDENAAYVGTNDDEVDYAVFQELGTVKIPAHPFLKPAVAQHAGEYRKIIEEELKDL